MDGMEWIVISLMALGLLASFVGVVGWCEARAMLVRDARCLLRRRPEAEKDPHQP